MLRWLILALVGANVVYYAGNQGYLVALGWPAANEPREPQRLERQIEPQRLRLLNGAKGDKGAEAAGAAPAAAPVAPVVPPPSEPARAEAAQTATTPAAPLERPAPTEPPPSPAPAVADTATACWQAAGFSEEQAELLRAELRLLGLADSTWQLSESRSPGRWIVYMGRYDTAEQASRKKAELRAMGIDFRDVNTPGLAPGLAVGTFSSEQAAREGLQLAERRGVRTARVVQERAESLSYNLRLPAITQTQRARIDALGPAMAERSLQRCG